LRLVSVLETSATRAFAAPANRATAAKTVLQFRQHKAHPSSGVRKMGTLFVAAVGFAVALSLVCNVAAATQKIVLKVNLGGGPVGDFLGESDVFDMEADDYPKQVSRAEIKQTDQMELFQHQRFSRSQDMMIRVPVPDGVYSVTLLMAELYQPACMPGARVFDISLGTPVSGLTKVVPAFDLYANAGCQSAYGKRFDNVVSKDGIVIRLGHKRQHPTLAGFIVEGYPVPKGDGSEYKPIAQAPVAGGQAEREGEAGAGEGAEAGAGAGAGAEAGTAGDGGVTAPGEAAPAQLQYGAPSAQQGAGLGAAAPAQAQYGAVNAQQEADLGEAAPAQAQYGAPSAQQDPELGEAAPAQALYGVPSAQQGVVAAQVGVARFTQPDVVARVATPQQYPRPAGAPQPGHAPTASHASFGAAAQGGAFGGAAAKAPQGRRLLNLPGKRHRRSTFGRARKGARRGLRGGAELEPRARPGLDTSHQRA
jgi:hypothetical protein